MPELALEYMRAYQHLYPTTRACVADVRSGAAWQRFKAQCVDAQRQRNKLSVHNYAYR